MNPIRSLKTWWRKRRAPRIVLPPVPDTATPTGYGVFLASLPEIPMPPIHPVAAPSVETLTNMLLEMQRIAEDTRAELADLSTEDGYRYTLRTARDLVWAQLETIRLLGLAVEPKVTPQGPIPIGPEFVQRAVDDLARLQREREAKSAWASWRPRE